MAGLSLARAFCVVRDGRALLAGSRALRGVESGAGKTRGGRRRLAVEQRPRAPGSTGRPAGESRRVICNGPRWEDVSPKRPTGRGTAAIARACADRPAVGRRHVPCGSGRHLRSHLEAAEARSETEARSELSCVSPEFRNSANPAGRAFLRAGLVPLPGGAGPCLLV